MDEGTSIANIGDLAKPATVLIEKISEAVGGLCKPWQIRRVAQAEAEAEKIREVAKIEIGELHRRALVRFIAEETRKQMNMEAITEQALGQLEDGAKPEQMENDWIAHFFEKSRIVSDQEMQALWARILAGEANRPGSYSKRTVNLLGVIDKEDAVAFVRLCSFVWMIHNRPTPLIYEYEDAFYQTRGISFRFLKHLETLGLISLAIDGISRPGLRGETVAAYYDTHVTLGTDKEEPWRLQLGQVIFTDSGEQLSRVCQAPAIPEYLDYTLRGWMANGYVTSRYGQGRRVPDSMQWILWDSPAEARPREWPARPGNLREVPRVTGRVIGDAASYVSWC